MAVSIVLRQEGERWEVEYRWRERVVEGRCSAGRVGDQRQGSMHEVCAGGEGTRGWGCIRSD